MYITFTLHSKKQIEKRNLTEQEIIESIKFLDKTIKKHDKYYFQKSIGRGMIEIVCEKMENNKQISKTGVFTHALSAFLRVYISRRGFKDGTGGFFISFCYSMVSFLSHLKLLKLQGKL